MKTPLKQSIFTFKTTLQNMPEVYYMVVQWMSFSVPLISCLTSVTQDSPGVADLIRPHWCHLLQ